MQVKYCEDCGVEIASWPGSPWHRFIRVKRCRECAAAAKRVQVAQCKRLGRRIKRMEKSRLKLAQECLSLELDRIRLEEQQIALLQQQNAALGGSTNWMGRGRSGIYGQKN